MALIEKRGPNQWRVKIRKKGFPTASKTFPKKAQAERWAREIESSMDSGIYHDYRQACAIALKELLKRYETDVLPRKKSQTPVKAQIRQINRHIGDTTLSMLKSTTIAQYRDLRMETVSNETVRKELLLIRRVIKTAIIDWGIHFPNGNPVEQVRLPKPSPARSRRLCEDEELKLLKSANDYGGYIHNIIVFAIETAMRRGEIVKIQREDIDFEKRTLEINETKTDIPRTIPLSPKALEILQGVTSEKGFIWNLNPDSITKAFERVCQRANIQNLRFHDLRHEGTSRFFEKGLNIMEVSCITGHKDLKMLKRYTHLKAENLAKKLG